MPGEDRTPGVVHGDIENHSTLKVLIGKLRINWYIRKCISLESYRRGLLNGMNCNAVPLTD